MTRSQREPRKPRMRAASPAIQQAARALRRKMTPAERVLWESLRHHGLGGLHFRRQHPLGRFVLDFYCAEARLCVEVDGGIHDDPAQREHDAARTQALNDLGIRELRVSNQQVLAELPRTLQVLAKACAQENGEEPA